MDGSAESTNIIKSCAINKLVATVSLTLVESLNFFFAPWMTLVEHRSLNFIAMLFKVDKFIIIRIAVTVVATDIQNTRKMITHE